jgi:3-phosphoshikimate 1-carboxyvinyltransferase
MVERKSITIHPSGVEGTIAAPGSKSVTIRAVAAGLLTQGQTRVLNPSRCDDALVAIEMAERMGARIRVGSNEMVITGGLKPFAGTLHCGDSGLAIRLFAAVAGLWEHPVQFTGDASLQSRPMHDLPLALQNFGVRVETRQGHLPVTVQGPMKGGVADIDGSVSSQYLTGLLMVLPLLNEPSEVRVHGLRSTPYIDLTISVLKAFGIHTENHDYRNFTIPGNQKYTGCDLGVEGDWSGAAFMMVAAALRGRVSVSNLDPQSKQADSRILNALREAGARVSIRSGQVAVQRNELRGFDFDMTDCPDLAPPLVALAAHCTGVSRLIGARRLEVKESRRGKVMVDEFRKLGVTLGLRDDVLSIEGGRVQGGGTVSTHRDHRIAMAASVLALNAEQPVEVLDPSCVNKSYPDFFRDLKTLGGQINE